MKYKQKYIPEINTPEEWKKLNKIDLRKAALSVAKNMAGHEVVNEDTKLKIHFSVTNARKTTIGSAMYLKKATALLIMPEIIRVAEYSNFGERKETDNVEVIGFLNFKAKCKINGITEYLRIAVQFRRNDKFFYNIEVNKIELLPKKSRRLL